VPESYPGETHDVRFSRRQSKKPRAVATDHYGWTGFLHRLNGDGMAAHSVVLTRKIGLFARE